ncbi:Rne/Rng family ribonuclease [Candidatus Binatia bacterium]|nr:Rne/Rng family ribonuclease [Candidatus Binatia bacterium]
MPKTMLINVTHAEESRVGIVADGVLVSFEIESFSREHLKGNIYRAVVHRVQPALDAAFVDIGADRDAFLPLDEVCFRNLSPAVREGNGNGERRRLRIQDVLKPGEEVLVQIAKEQFGNKPPTLSTFYSLPGRYLVLLPGSDDAGISRRIEGEERQRIRSLIEKLDPPEGFGIIVRTVAGFDQGVRELQRDLSYLLRLWESIRQAAQTKRAPALVYREHDLVLRNIRDYFTPDIDEIYVDNEEVFLRAQQFLRDVMPDKEQVLRLYQGDQPIFSHFNVESQIESIYKRRVPLKSGGSIVIDGTEALTAIDVNSGRSTRGGSQEETAFKTNQEAAVEIARQLRLRDLGGLIVIDFIDMRSPQHVSEIEKTLRQAMHEDKARHEVGRISHFGLLEVSRQRLRPAAAATSYVACPMCEGHGLVRTTESAALVALRKLHNRIAHGDLAALKVSVPRDVAIYLLNQKREDLAQLERRYGTRIQVVLREDLMPHQSEFEGRPRVDGESTGEPTGLRLGGVTAPAEASVPAPAATATNQSQSASGPVPTAPDKNGKRRRRRRGRRRGRGVAPAVAVADGLVELGTRLGLAAPAAVTAAPSEATEPTRAKEFAAGIDSGADIEEEEYPLDRQEAATAEGAGDAAVTSTAADRTLDDAVAAALAPSAAVDTPAAGARHPDAAAARAPGGEPAASHEGPTAVSARPPAQRSRRGVRGKAAPPSRRAGRGAAAVPKAPATRTKTGSTASPARPAAPGRQRKNKASTPPRPGQPRGRKAGAGRKPPEGRSGT